jgi:hypothetical protein
MYKLFSNKLKQFLNYLVEISDKEWHKNMYKYSKYISIILIILTYTGFFYVNPRYINIVHNFLLYYVCITLLIRFNPLIKQNTSASYVEFNRNVAFTASLILLTSLVASNVSEAFVSLT